MQQQNESVEDRIEDYLDRALAPLVATVPYAKRQELRTEMRVRLMARIEANSALGFEPNAALEKAMKHPDGSPITALEWLERAEQVLMPASTPSVRTASRLALTAFVVNYAVYVGMWVGHMTSNLEPKTAAETILLLGAPLFSGTAIGLLFRARPAGGALRAISLTVVPFFLLVWRTGPDRWGSGQFLHYLPLCAEIAAFEVIVGYTGMRFGEAARESIDFLWQRRAVRA